jgi:hypothetical protein
MKNIFKSLLLLCSVCLFAACADDNDSNPTLTIPATFQLNTPAFAQSYTDLATSATLPFTWSQPDYGGFPAAAQYQMQFSLNQNFTISVAEAEADETGATVADYVALDQIYNGCNGAVDPAQLAKGLQQIAHWSESSVPATTTVYARLVADYANKLVYSNIVPINVIPYYVELKNAAIELWWLIGSDIADGSWGGDMGKSIIPMQAIEGEEYDKKTGQGKIQWIGYLAGNGFKLKEYPDSWDYQWGQGDSFGTFVKNDGGSSDIKVPAAGLYTITLDTGKDNLKVEAYEGTAKVFDGMAISGSFNDWGDTAMNPCSTDWENHDWYITQHLDSGTEIKIKQAGSWDFNKGGELIPDGDNMFAFGVDGGSNFKIEEAADYLIIFNDITGFVRFIKQ